MQKPYTWKEAKRRSNLAKHGLDFTDDAWVLDNSFRFDIDSTRNGEQRIQSFDYVAERLTVLTVVHLPCWHPHIISFRPASRDEQETYHDWLENEFNDS